MALEKTVDVYEYAVKDIVFTFKDTEEMDEDYITRMVTDETEGLIEAGYDETHYEEFYRKSGNEWIGVINVTFEKRLENDDG